MRQLAALMMVVSSTLAYGAIAGRSVSATGHQVAGYGQDIAQIEQAVKQLPCALSTVGPREPGCSASANP
jgi:hypothetical protein